MHMNIIHSYLPTTIISYKLWFVNYNILQLHYLQHIDLIIYIKSSNTKI